MKIMSVATGVIILLGALLAAQANAMEIISGDGNEACLIAPFTVGTGPNCTAQTISVDPRWQPNNPDGKGAQWISFADTGYHGSTLAQPRDDNFRATVMH